MGRDRITRFITYDTIGDNSVRFISYTLVSRHPPVRTSFQLPLPLQGFLCYARQDGSPQTASRLAFALSSFSGGGGSGSSNHIEAGGRKGRSCHQTRGF